MTAIGKAGISRVAMYALPLTAWGVLLAVGYWPTRVLADDRGIRSMITAQALVVLAVYLSMVSALRCMARSDAVGRFPGVMRGAVIRYLVTLALTGLILWHGAVETRVFLIWVAISYLVMLKVETLVLVYGIRRFSVPPQTPQGQRSRRTGTAPGVSERPLNRPPQNTEIACGRAESGEAQG